jgi:G3E family GTPase
VTILSGFLGSGKTTLLRSALSKTDASATPVIVLNDVAGGFADDLLLVANQRPPVVISGGCVCCNRLDALVQVLSRQLDEEPAGSPSPRNVVIETSGLSDPGPVALAIASHPMLRHHYELTRICVTIDALHGLRTIEEQEMAFRQLLAADEVIVTKADLAQSTEIDEVCDRVRTLNPSAVVTVAVRGQRIQTFPAAGHGCSGSLLGGSQARSSNVATVEFSAAEPLDWQALSIWLSLLLHRHGDAVLRIKGSLEIDGVGHVSLNAVRHVVHPPEHIAPTSRPGSRLVCIVQGIDPDRLRRSFETLVESRER